MENERAVSWHHSHEEVCLVRCLSQFLAQTGALFLRFWLLLIILTLKSQTRQWSCLFKHQHPEQTSKSCQEERVKTGKPQQQQQQQQKKDRTFLEWYSYCESLAFRFRKDQLQKTEWGGFSWSGMWNNSVQIVYARVCVCVSGKGDNWKFCLTFQPRKSKESTKATGSDQPLHAPQADGRVSPTSSALPQNSAPAESRHSQEQGLPVSTTVQSRGAKGAALGVEAKDGGTLVTRDLETDGWEVRQDSDLAALPSQIQQGLVLPDEENLPAPPVVSASGDVLAAEPDILAENHEENSLDRGAVGAAVPTADLLHLDEGADREASQPLLDAGLQASAPPPSLESLHASPQSEPGTLLPDPIVPAPSALPLAHQPRATTEAISSPTAPQPQPRATTEATSSPTAPQPQPQAPIEATSPTAPQPQAQSSTKSTSSTAPHPQAQSSTKPTSPTAPHPQAQSSTKPTSLTAPHPQAQSSTKPTSPTAPQLHPSSVAVSPSTEQKSLAEATSSAVTHRPLYPKVPVLESPVEGKFQPMSTEQLQQLYYNPELQANAKFVEDFVLVSFPGPCSWWFLRAVWFEKSL